MDVTLEKEKISEKIFTQDYELNDGEPEPLFDKYGNPTPETLEAIYEVENGLTEEVSFEELMAWANE